MSVLSPSVLLSVNEMEQTTLDTACEGENFVYQAEPEQPLSEAVVTAIAVQSDAEDVIDVAHEFGPLYDAIDPGALDALFDSSNGSDRSRGGVTFTYAGRCVKVDTTGRVTLCSIED